MEELNSENDGYDIVLIGEANSTQDAEDAFENYLGTGLEICLGDYLKLTSNCPTGSGFVVRFSMQVLDISQVTITFKSPTQPDVVVTVSMTSSLPRSHRLFYMLYTRSYQLPCKLPTPDG